MRRGLVLALSSLVICGCVTGYRLVEPGRVRVVGGALAVRPNTAWNKEPRGPDTIPGEERWTENGPLLDSITFIAALPDGAAIARQRSRDDRQVPKFYINMSPEDLVTMLESYYRIRLEAQVFKTTGVRPTTFLGGQAIQVDYEYTAADQLRRRGRSVIAVKNEKLYLIALDGAALHYFDAALPDFQAIVASASTS